MFDYYALPEDFPGFNESKLITDVRERISFLESKFLEEMATDAFIPYIQLHEFEALLFVDIDQLIPEYPLADANIHKLKLETDKYGDPEMIDDGPATAPSKRIISALEKYYHYNKVKSGVSTTSRIGIDALLENCRHFKMWITNIKKNSVNDMD